MKIERTVILKSTLDKVWNAIGTPEGFQGWFKSTVIGDWGVGQTVTLQWPSGSSLEIRIVASEPKSRFVYSWHPGGAHKIADLPEAELTTIAFDLREVAEGVELKLVESGFEAIPDERRLKVLGMNTAGWDEELEAIRTYVEA